MFAIQYHDHLQVLVAPYVVQVAQNGQFMYGFQRLYGHTAGDHFDHLTDTEQQLMKHTDACSDLFLCRKFSKTARSAEALYAELSPSKLKSVVMPYVQGQISKCLEILQSHGMALYFKGEKDKPVDGEEIMVAQESAKAIFHFIKDEEGLRYKLVLQHQGAVIPLLAAGSMVLSVEPGWVLADRVVYRLAPGVDGNKVRPFFTKEFVTIPEAFEEKYYKGFMLQVIKHHEVKLDGIRLEVETAACKPLLRLEYDLDGRPMLMLYFHYNQKSCLATDSHRSWVELEDTDGKQGFRKTMRDLPAEDRHAQSLRELGLSSIGRNTWYLPAAKDAGGIKEKATAREGAGATGQPDGQRNSLFDLIEWMGRQSDKLQKLGFGIAQDFLETRYVLTVPRLDIHIGTSHDWFDVYAVAVFGEHRIPFLRLKEHLLNGIREYQLPGGEVVILPEEWFSRYNGLLVYGQEEDGHLRMRRHHFRLVEQLDGQSDSLYPGADPDSPVAFDMPEVPPALDRVLRPYQRTGYAWLYWLKQNGFGGCLADDMGLGKTLQTLALLLRLKQESQPVQRKTSGIQAGAQLTLFEEGSGVNTAPACTSLIIMPLSLVYNWEKEIRRFAPVLNVVKYLGSARDTDPGNLLQYDIVLTTYGIVRNDAEILKDIPFCHVILDESQLIKNPKAQVSEAVNKLNAKHRLVLTGTPIENSLDDLWSQLSFVNPGMLGSLPLFRKAFAQPIVADADEAKKEQLAAMIKPFILRRTKEQVEPDLPGLTENVHYCEMSDAQRSLYESKKSETRNQILEMMTSGNRSRWKINVLQSLMQLRLLANHPMLINKSAAPSGKFEEVMRMTGNLMDEGHKVLIFSQFVKHLQLFRDHFTNNDMAYAWLTGQQTPTQREQTIADFQNDPARLLFLVSLKAGGVGLNLTAADYVFILDPWWNPAVENQAVSRAHRIGQHRHVFSYKFITVNSVEEKILGLQQAKSRLAGDFISTNNPLKDFTDEEILEMFD